MIDGGRYRATSAAGTALLVVLAVVGANVRPVQEAFARVPYLGRPAPAVLSGGDLLLAVLTALVVVLGSAWPLFKPRPRRILDAILETQRRVVFAMVGLAALGYFNYTYRLPRSTLLLATGALLLVLPALVVTIRQRPRSGGRALLVGDDADAMRTVLADTDLPVVGYVGPSNLSGASFRLDGEPVEQVGGLSRVDEAIVETDADTVLLAFGSPDRSEFFGTLATCHEHGLAARIHREYADSVLTARDPEGELVAVDLEPWDLQDRLLKRLFDVAFAGTALLVLAPVVAAIAVAIRVEDGGPVLYSQERTAEFGDTFTVYKFRSMVPEAEADTGATLSDEDAGGRDARVTRVGQVLRQTHLDEIPQLWSILVGDMSVVGPRPERPELESEMESGTAQWRSRWFVKPGLTGLAQVNDATGYDPGQKLRYDVNYVREQSLRADIEIVLRQLWQVGHDAVAYLRADEPGDSVTGTGTDPTADTADRVDATGDPGSDARGTDGVGPNREESATRPVQESGPGRQ